MKTEPADVRITVDGAEFYSFVRALKRAYRVSDLGEVVMAVRGGELMIETARGGCVLPCNDSGSAVARFTGANFFRLANLVKDANAAGPLTIHFRPEFGEVLLPHAGSKAKFDEPAKSNQQPSADCSTQISKAR